MRIISGLHRGRKLITPKNQRVRPTGDKVKEAIFSSIRGAYEEKTVCDLFAGTGNLGLEALSRGSRFCYFGDFHKESIGLIEENIRLCREEERSRVIKGDFRAVLDEIQEPVDLFFLDPPYGKKLPQLAMEAIASKGLLAEQGMIVAEHDKKDILEQTVAGFSKVKEKNYGIVVVSIYI